MKRIYTSLSIFLLCAASLFGQKAEKTEHGIAFENKDGVKGEIIVYTPSIVRVVKYPTAQKPEKQSLSVVCQPEEVAFTAKTTGATATVSTPKISVTVDMATGNVRFTAAGKSLLKEKSTSFEERTSGSDKGSYIVSQSFTLDKDEAIYGLGILQDGKMNRRNSHFRMEQSNTEDYVNIMHSAKGYALFWDNYSPTDFTDNANGMEFKSEVGDLSDYYIVYGGNPDGVIAQIRKLTGEVPMVPLWAYGFMQSRERYKSTDELLEVFRKYRALKIPVDVMIQDWQYWGSNYTWNAMEFNAESFVNYKDMIKEVHDGGAKMMISIWSSFGPMTKQYREMKPKGMLYEGIGTWPQSGISHVWPPIMDYPSGVLLYDVFNAEARDIYWKHLTRLADAGLDGWWMDSTDPDFFDPKEADYNLLTAMGSWRKMRNAYPLVGVEGVYDHQRQYSEDKRVMILTRSMFAGQQRTGANTWSGDTGSSWETLRKQVSAGLNFSLTGNPNYNHDLGGFFASAYGPRDGENCGMNNPLYRELYVRWLQQGIFLPMMRSHGESFPREFYYYGKEGEPVYDAMVEAVRFRYKLIPYIYSLAHEVSANNGTFMRALMMDFPQDKKVYDMGDEYMFGPALLTAPIIEAQYTTEKVIKVDAMSGWNHDNNNGVDTDYLSTDFTAEKSADVYLPKGTKWYNFWTNEVTNGGQTLTIATHLNTIPLYVKAGSIIPIGPDVQYTSEKKWDDLEIRVYTGANGAFTLYEDEGDNYNYEKGVCSTIKFTWDDKAGKLKIGAREGEFPGMLQNRTFRVVIVKNGKASAPTTVNYTGAVVLL